MYAGGEDKSSVKNSTQHSQTRSPGLEYFGAANKRAAFLYIASPFILWKYKGRTTQWSAAHRAASTSIPVPTMPLKHRSSSGRERAILATPSYAHGNHMLVLMRMHYKN
jgi:hypothetical protein